MFELADNTVHCVITSSLYCMILKWDNLFAEQTEDQRKVFGGIETDVFTYMAQLEVLILLKTKICYSFN
jgi:hypothetical protein